MKRNIFNCTLAWVAAVTIWLPATALAATIAVTTTADNGVGSLRRAIEVAAPSDTINFSVAGTITLTNGQLLITNDLNILGPGATNLAVSGNNTNRVFEIASNTAVRISGLTISNGRISGSKGTDSTNGPAGDGGRGLGGGILNAGTLALNQCVMMKNSAYGGDGGAATNFNNGGVGGSGFGGAIYNLGDLTLANSEVLSNSAAGGHGGANDNSRGGDGGNATGGALCVAAGNVWVSNCKFIANTAVGSDGASGFFGRSLASVGGHGRGGAVGIETGAILLANCTVLSNSVTGGSCQGIGNYPIGGNGNGGGIFLSNGVLILNATTLCGNSALGGGSGSVGTFGAAVPGGIGGGGGLFAESGVITLSQCCLAANSVKGGRGGNAITQFGSYGSVGGFAGGGGAFLGSSVLVVVNCTVASNSASGGPGGFGGGLPGFGPFPGGAGGGGYGGGFFVSGGSGTNIGCTIGGNSVVGGAGGSGNPSGAQGGSSAGGIGSSTGALSLLNVIVAANNATAIKHDVSGDFLSQGFNLIGVTNGSSGWVATDLTGNGAMPVDPSLGPLRNNGGSTFTMALLPDSPALNHGDDALLTAPFNLTDDQRGLPRKSGNHVDIGAYELQAPNLIELHRSGSDIAIIFTTEFGWNYRLERTHVLSSDSWTSVADNVTGTGGTVQVLDSGPAIQPQYFYRVVMLP